MSYFYGLYNNDILRFLTSSRSNFLEVAFSYYTETGNFLLRLLGFGFYTRVAEWKGGYLVEMDFVDILFSLGIIGLFVTVMLLLYLLIKACKKRTIYSILFIILILYGAIAGHVLFSALSSTLFGLVCGGLFIQKESLSEKNENSH
ncbi:O-antigen ligase family protein [Listeria fleischmannii]|uniref:O-antigen ligase family protein n=1 Tax=Listeria fleischmannii TaxID=1069827 RepID=UPI0005607F3D|nr:O-antigen ligase family protein [Listeria fleischmannii]